MGKRLDADIHEWAQSVVFDMDKSGVPGINVVEKILRDPGASTGESRHRVHWWPKNPRIARVSRAMHAIDKISQICLVIDAGVIGNGDGKTFDKYELAKYSSITVRKFNELVKKSKAIISDKLYT